MAGEWWLESWDNAQRVPDALWAIRLNTLDAAKARRILRLRHGMPLKDVNRLWVAEGEPWGWYEARCFMRRSGGACAGKFEPDLGMCRACYEQRFSVRPT